MNYPPQGGGQYQGGAYMPPPDPNAQGAGGRSGIPKVMGILMIVFASIGLLFTLIGAGGSSTGLEGDVADKLSLLNNIELIAGLLIGVLHLVAGIMTVRYKANGPKLAIIYGITKIVWTVVSLVLVYAWLMPALNELGAAGDAAKNLFAGLFIVFGILAIIWPVIVLSLMTRPKAKASCTN
jgi:hypothetical protein